MKQLLLSFFLFVGLGTAAFAQDYSAIKIPAFPDPIVTCAGGLNVVAYQIIDNGANGFNTNYSISSSNPTNLTLTALGVPLDGTVNNGTSIFVPVQYTVAPTAPPGLYSIDLVMFCGDVACSDPVEIVSFNILVNEAPAGLIQTPDGTLTCDGENLTLQAKVLNSAADVSYLWNTGSTDQSIVVNTGGVYSVTMSNECGSVTETVTIEQGSSPVITGQTCDNFGISTITTVTVDDPDLLGLTFQWFEDGSPISTGGDFLISSGPNSSTLTVFNVPDHDLSIFTLEATNACGTATATGCVAVPVVWAISKEKYANRKYLQWATETEVDNEKFLVERSFNGRDFDVIGTVGGAGTSYELNEYSFADRQVANIGSAELYYRIKQVDFDGDHSFSDVIVLPLKSGIGFKLTNAVSDGSELHVQFYSAFESKVQAEVFDLNGRSFIQMRGLGNTGFNQLEVPVYDLPNGLYFVRLSNGQDQQTLRFVQP